MPVDIRYAALTPEVERRLRLAARTLAAHQVDATVDAWAGWGCALAVVNSDDAYGRRVLTLALEHDVPVIAVGTAPLEGDTVLHPTDVSIGTLAREMQNALSTARPKRGTRQVIRAVPSTTARAVGSDLPSAWRRLTTDLAGSDIEARSGSRRVYLMRSRGRVLAPTLSDLLEARDHFNDNDWVLRTIDRNDAAGNDAEVGTSLDSFLLSAAVRGADTLSDYPRVACGLRDWPDLGAAPEAVEGLQVAAMLVRHARTTQDIVDATALSQRTVSACFWAFSASGLLQTRDAPSAMPAPPPPRAGGMLSRLAAHFGLFKS